MSTIESHSAYNRREFTRVSLHLQAQVHSGDRAFTASTRDLSFQGLFLVTDLELPAGTELAIRLCPTDRPDLVQVDIRAEVVDYRGDGLACRIAQIDDTESFQHLRRFVLYNSPDPEQSQAEIDRHLLGKSKPG